MESVVTECVSRVLLNQHSLPVGCYAPIQTIRVLGPATSSFDGGLDDVFIWDLGPVTLVVTNIQYLAMQDETSVF